MKTLALVVIVVMLVACQEKPTARAYSSSDSVSAAQRLARRRIGYDAFGNPTTTRLSEVAVTAVEAPLPFIAPDATANMLIRTATASIEVDSLEVAIEHTKQLAARVGGFVANSSVEAGKNRVRSATLEVKLPAQRFEEGLAGLKPIGKLESVNVAAEDVGEEFVDVTARMENARRLERRLIELLANRTGKLKDVLAVEESLARVREEIERHEGRIRYLNAHTAMSTLSVTVHEPFPIVGTAGKSVMGEAFTQAWRNFVVLLAFVVQSLGVVLPLAVVAIAAWMLTKRVRLAKQRAA
ncbi:MAG TPA: DUF4349 domain-containing protein [Gemmatimonadales bacterium]|nr:DUF4349 domain-containing protein [Gemmatimonadales bacterium]